MKRREDYTHQKTNCIDCDDIKIIDLKGEMFIELVMKFGASSL